MSQKATRKAAVSEDKEKRQTDSPVKEMKKKMAANAEKEKQAAEKAEKSTEKAAEKQTEKNTDKQAEKSDKSVAEKKSEKNDKQAEKPDKNATDKKSEKSTDKKEPQAEKSKEDANKEEKTGKSEKSDQKKAESKPKQNGRDQRVHNGVSDVTLSANGASDEVLNGTVSAESEDDDVMLVIDDQDQDELFPELTYDDGSDVEGFEPPTPDSAPSRSLTRRSQVKAARTPETPRPASDKHADKEPDDPKDSKVLKLKEDASTTDRKLRSADSPKPESKKDTKKQEKESPKKAQEKEVEEKSEDKGEETGKEDSKSQGESKGQEEEEKKDKVEMEVVIEVEADATEESRKPDTNYSKSRVKVSPYRRSLRLADQTNSSVLANYTGNNTTMEMDITETSSFISEDVASLDDSSYLRGLRSIRGRNSYKPLKEMTLRHMTANRSATSTTTLSSSESHNRPTGTVVGRKRKPDADELADTVSAASATSEASSASSAHAYSKRLRLLDKLAVPFRRSSAARNPEIVGINTDLPLTAPVASAETFDPESLKPAAPDAPVAVPLAHTQHERDNKRCAIM